MVTIESYALAVVACVVATVGWGSWQSTINAAGWVLGHPWRFELYGWDFLCGILFLAILWALTFGSLGRVGRGLPSDLSEASVSSIALAMSGGVIWGGGMVVSRVASSKAHFAISYGLSGSSPVAALGGVLGWKEFAAAPPVAYRLFGGRFTCCLIGLALIVMAGPVEYRV